MKTHSIVRNSLIALLMAVFAINAQAETFLVRGNSQPIEFEITQYEERNGSIFFEHDLQLILPYTTVSLANVSGELWDLDEKTGVYESATVEFMAQDFFSQLYGNVVPITYPSRNLLALTVTEGRDLTTRVPLDSKKRYFQVEATQGSYLSFGPMDFELAILQAEAELGLGLEEPTLFFTGALSGLGAFLSPISMAGFGVSTKKVFKYEAKTTFGLSKEIRKQMIFNGQLAIVGSAGIPKLPISLTGELVTQFDGPLVENRKQGFNGNLEASYKFSGELGLSLQLGDASAMFQRPTLLGKKDELEMTFSGVQDPTFPLLPADFPLQPGKEMKIAGRMSSKIDRSFFNVHTDYSVLNIPLSEGRLFIDKKGVFASGFWKTPISKIELSGEVSNKKVAMRGTAKAKIDVNGTLKTVETITNAAVCGTKMATDGAKCGYDYLYGKVRCAAGQISHRLCMADCKRQGDLQLGMRGRFTCEMRCFATVSTLCKKAKRCRVAKTCKRTVSIPNTNLGHISAEVSLLLSNEGLGGDVAAEFCPLKKKCAKLPAGNVNLDVSDLTKPKVCIGKGVAGSNKGLCVGF